MTVLQASKTSDGKQGVDAGLAVDETQPSPLLLAKN
jgi:hypothetical protein